MLHLNISQYTLLNTEFATNHGQFTLNNRLNNKSTNIAKKNRQISYSEI